MERTRLFRVDDMSFVQKVVVSQLRFVLDSAAFTLPNFTLFLKKLPEMLISSHRTTTIFWPLRVCLEIMDASRPRRWPFPSMTIGVEENVAMADHGEYLSLRTDAVTCICKVQATGTRDCRYKISSSSTCIHFVPKWCLFTPLYCPERSTTKRWPESGNCSCLVASPPLAPQCAVVTYN